MKRLLNLFSLLKQFDEHDVVVIVGYTIIYVVAFVDLSIVQCIVVALCYLAGCLAGVDAGHKDARRNVEHARLQATEDEGSNERTTT